MLCIFLMASHPSHFRTTRSSLKVIVEETLSVEAVSVSAAGAGLCAVEIVVANASDLSFDTECMLGQQPLRWVWA